MESGLNRKDKDYHFECVIRNLCGCLFLTLLSRIREKRLKMHRLVLILSVICATNGYHYNGYPYYEESEEERTWREAPHYPSYCCPLEWVNMTQGEELPKDWIRAGTFLGRNFAFSRGAKGHEVTAVKSSRKDEPPYAFGFSTSNPFPILTNPNKCHIDWYETTRGLHFPQPNEEIFFPSTGYTQYGSYAHFQGRPGMMDYSGDFFNIMTSLSSYDWYKSGGVKVMFVDCKKSFRNMYSFKLVKLLVDDGNIRVMKYSKSGGKVEHFKKKIVNNSSREITETINYSFNVTNFVDFILDNVSYGEYLLKGEKYFDSFLSTDFRKVISFMQFEGESKVMNLNWNVDEKQRKILNLVNEKQFRFQKNVLIPAYSTVEIIINSDRKTSSLPFSAVYDMSPKKAGDNLITMEMLETDMDRYNIKVPASLDNVTGKMNYSFANDVNIDVKITRIRLNSQFTTKLSKLVFNQDTVDKLKKKPNRIQYVKKQFTNHSPNPMTSNVNFAIPTSDHLNLTLDSFQLFQSRVDNSAYSEWEDSTIITRLLTDVKFEHGPREHALLWNVPTLGDEPEVIMKPVQIFGVYHRENHEFKQTIISSPSSKVTLIAYSNPIKAKIPFQAVYEIIPKMNSSVSIELLRSDVGNDPKIEGTEWGTFHVIFNGTMDINSGNDVHLVVKEQSINRS